MDELRTRLLLNAIETLRAPDDYKLREILKKELAREFNLPTKEITNP